MRESLEEFLHLVLIQPLTSVGHTDHYPDHIRIRLDRERVGRRDSHRILTRRWRRSVGVEMDSELTSTLGVGRVLDPVRQKVDEDLGKATRIGSNILRLQRFDRLVAFDR